MLFLLKLPRVQKGNYVQPVTTRGFSRKVLRRLCVLQAASMGSDLLPGRCAQGPKVWKPTEFASLIAALCHWEAVGNQSRTIIVFFLGYMESTNQMAKACKLTVLYLHPTQKVHTVCIASCRAVDISILTNHGLETVSFKSVIPVVPLGWFVAVFSSLQFMHPR